jgi:hypothetical protein
MSDHCYACGVSLHLPDFKGPAEEFCKYCTDGEGQLKPHDEVHAGIAKWLQSWSPPGLSDQQANDRAHIYMKSMPAWAD